tara:strand:- start:12533 stop:14266 length:1734 start_codon:yes stop_codon:yes gene_type:complete
MSVKISGKLIKHIPCTSASCTSSDGMALYKKESGEIDGYCFVCGHFDPSPLESGQVLDQAQPSTAHSHSSAIAAKAEVRSSLNIHQVSECPSLPILDRGIKQFTVDFYEVKTILNGYDGKTPVATCFPYYKYDGPTPKLSGYKKRLIEDKIFTSIGDTKETMLFGAQKFLSGGKRLYITEGEMDCLALYQVLKELASPEFRHLEPCVVSLPHGAKSAANAIHANQKFINQFEETILVFDQDEPGREAANEVCSFMDPRKTKIATFSEKDPNDMLMLGKAQELKWAVLTKAKHYQPEGITTSSKLLTEALSPQLDGRPWPWPTLTKLTHGRRPGLYGIGAGVGIGKTEFFHELIYFIAETEKKPLGIFLLEEAPQRTLRDAAGKHLNTPLHRPDIHCDSKDVESAIARFSEPTEKLYLFDHKGSRDWDTIYSQCKYLAAVHGVRDIIIDPLTAIISHEENTDRMLHKIMADMAVLTQAPYNCTVYYSSHLNEPPRDRIPHEEGGRVKESHFAGSRAMIRFSNLILGLERNKQDIDVVQRNTTICRVLKDRDFGTATGETFEIYYNPETGRYLEENEDF